jgi:hypothetical protein
MGEQSECIGITLKVDHVVPEYRTYLALEVVSGSLGKERLDGLLTAMTKGWIAQVVSQTGSRYYLTNLLE